MMKKKPLSISELQLGKKTGKENVLIQPNRNIPMTSKESTLKSSFGNMTE